MKLSSIRLKILIITMASLFFVVSAQSDDPFGGDPFGGDPFGGMIDSSKKVPTIPSNSGSSSSNTGTQQSTHSNTYTTGSQGTPQYPFSQTTPEPEVEEPSNFQNAIIEGIQLTAEKSEATDERVISCYFIFRDKPTSYFYEVKIRDKKLIFEFNDTKTGSSPVPTASEYPIKGFRIESGKMDINKDVKGLMPEWHDMIRVIFDVDQVPKVHVSDEYSIISFSFKWTSDPSKYKLYTLKDNSRKVIAITTATVGGALIGGGAYALYKILQPPESEKPITTDDLPLHDLGSHNFGF
ncbi:MAG TPA: hypothetical protein VHO70_20780 [Chitinispirillaceae bacterium]|nr:hypothetical protein [Chitinispirillaceae bacterium]